MWSPVDFTYYHGDGLSTGGVNPDLCWSSVSIHDVWQQIVREGLLQSVGMAGFKEFVSEEDAEAIRQYVLSEAHRVCKLQRPDWRHQQR